MHRNWKCLIGEIDLIARAPSGEMVIIEVKARRYPANAWEAFDRRKQNKLARLARYFLKVTDLPLETPLRFDAITVDLTTDKVSHEPNAFTASHELDMY